MLSGVREPASALMPPPPTCSSKPVVASKMWGTAGALAYTVTTCKAVQVQP